MRSPVGWFLIESAVFLAGAWLLAWTLAEASIWVAIGPWSAYFAAFGILGMRLAHCVGVRGPSEKRRGAPDV
jgi:hypothetical protein